MNVSLNMSVMSYLYKTIESHEGDILSMLLSVFICFINRLFESGGQNNND